MEEWKEYKLGEIFDFNNGLSKGGKFFGHGYDFVSFKTVFKNHFLPNTLDDLVESSKKEREKFSVKEGDVFLTLWGIERSGFFNGREKWAKGFENQRV